MRNETIQLGDVGEPVDFVRKYLQKFGYLNQPDPPYTDLYESEFRSDGPAWDEPCIAALVQFQRNTSLPMTGVVDSATLAMMRRPRCGVLDKVPPRITAAGAAGAFVERLFVGGTTLLSEAGAEVAVHTRAAVRYTSQVTFESEVSMKLDLNKSIARKVEAFKKAEQVLIDEALKQQRKCKHEVVWEISWQSLSFGGCLNACRMCVVCRYEEEGSHWSGGSTWSRNAEKDKGFYPSVLGGKLLAPKISRDQFYANRLSVKVPDYVKIDFAEEARREAAKWPYMPCPNKSRDLDPLEGCGDCGGCGNHRSIPNPNYDPSIREQEQALKAAQASPPTA